MASQLCFEFPDWQANVKPLHEQHAASTHTASSDTLGQLLQDLDELEDVQAADAQGNNQEQGSRDQQAHRHSSYDVSAESPTASIGLQDVPQEVLNLIMALLDIESLLALSACNKEFTCRVTHPSTADTWLALAGVRANPVIAATVQSLLAPTDACPVQLCQLSIKLSRKEVAGMHSYLRDKYLQLWQALLVQWQPPDNSASEDGFGASPQPKQPDQHQQRPNSINQGHHSAQGVQHQGSGVPAAAAAAAAAVGAPAPLLFPVRVNGAGTVLYTASQGVLVGGPVALSPTKQKCLDPTVLLAQLLKYEWGVALECVAHAFEAACDVIAITLLQYQLSSSEQQTIPVPGQRLLPELLSQFAVYRSFLLAVNSRCPKLKDMISAEREAEAMAQGAPSTPTLFAIGMASFRSQVLLRFGLRSRIQSCLTRACLQQTPPFTAMGCDPRGSTSNPLGQAMRMLKDLDVGDDLTKSTQMHTQEAMRERYGYSDRLGTFVLPLRV